MPDMDWIEQELAEAELGDKRLDARLKTLVSALAAAPQASLPQACGGQAATKAAYRFLSNEQVTPQSIRDAQHSAVLGRARRERTVLVLHDSTQLDFSTQPQMQGLGPLRAPTQQGRHVHSGLVVSLQGLPLGILWQQTWRRDPQKTGQSKERKKRDVDDKESRKWRDGLQATHDALPNTVYSINVGDREADMYPFLVEARPPNSDFVVRACYDRRISEEAHTLEAALAQAPVLGQQEVVVARRKGEAARSVTLEVRVATVTLRPPANYPKGTYAPVVVQVVLACEVAPPDEATALRWLLLTRRRRCGGSS